MPVAQQLSLLDDLPRSPAHHRPVVPEVIDTVLRREDAALAVSLSGGKGLKEPDDRLREFLTGALLGDGWIGHDRGKPNARYAEGGKNEDYLRWKHDVVSEYVHCTLRERVSAPHVRSGKQYRGWWLRSGVHPLLTEWWPRWYPAGKKAVPFELLRRHLTPLALTVWFCDDGYAVPPERTSSGGHADLYSLAFTRDEVEGLAALLLERFGLESRLALHGKGKPF